MIIFFGVKIQDKIDHDMIKDYQEDVINCVIRETETNTRELSSICLYHTLSKILRTEIFDPKAFLQRSPNLA